MAAMSIVLSRMRVLMLEKFMNQVLWVFVFTVIIFVNFVIIFVLIVVIKVSDFAFSVGGQCYSAHGDKAD